MVRETRVLRSEPTDCSFSAAVGSTRQHRIHSLSHSLTLIVSQSVSQPASQSDLSLRCRAMGMRGRPE